MKFDFTLENHTLEFKIPAKTSRNIFFEKKHWILKIWEVSKPEIKGIGEAAPLEFLSPDFNINFEEIISGFLYRINNGECVEEIDFSRFPSVKFAIESAFIDLENGGKQIYYVSDFLFGKPIPINGLVWMNNIDEMLAEAILKSKEGYNCIKFKIGSHDFDKECRMIETFRKSEYGKNVLIRLDANGAFDNDESLEKLKELSIFNIHSIEQPIKVGQLDDLEKICKESKIKIALDEELINLNSTKEIEYIFSKVKPHFIVLKPTLLGGISNSEKWINYALKFNTSWWVTSALESNIGLNIISQWLGKLNPSIHQGLGTGMLYKNNFHAKSFISNGELFYQT